MKAKTLVVSFSLLVFAFLPAVAVYASEDETAVIEAGKALVESKVDCADLNDEQLEQIGEYVMEQMHPGEQHEIMDKMMGGEGSESLRLAHITMARSWYCGENSGYGMMGMMGGGMMGAQFNGGMMNQGWNQENGQFMFAKSGFGGMMGGNLMSGYRALCVITIILAWLFLLSGIGAFAKYLFKK